MLLRHYSQTVAPAHPFHLVFSEVVVISFVRKYSQIRVDESVQQQRVAWLDQHKTTIRPQYAADLLNHRSRPREVVQNAGHDDD